MGDISVGALALLHKSQGPDAYMCLYIHIVESSPAWNQSAWIARAVRLSMMGRYAQVS